MPTAANSKLPPPKKFLQLRCSSRWKQEQMDHRRHCCSGDEARSRRLTGSCRSRRPLPPPPGLDSPPHLNSFAPDNYAAALSATHRQFSQCREHQASTTEEIPTTPSLQQPLETGAIGPPPPLLLWRRSSPPPPPNKVVQKPPSVAATAWTRRRTSTASRSITTPPPCLQRTDNSANAAFV